MTDLENRLRWEGEMQARVADAERRLDAINGSIQNHASATNDLALKVGGLSVRVSVYAALGSAVGGGFVSAAVSLAIYFATGR